MAKQKNKKANQVSKVKSQNAPKHDTWDELKMVGLMTFLDIQNPHVIVGEMKREFKEIFDEDKQLSDLVDGLDKSYYDCFDSCLSLMAQHVEDPKDFPLTHSEVLKNPTVFETVKFKTGVVGYGIEDKDKLFDEILSYRSLHTKYHELAHQINALTVKGKTEVEQRLIATNKIKRDPVEVEAENKKLNQLLSNSKESIESSKDILGEMTSLEKM